MPGISAGSAAPSWPACYPGGGRGYSACKVKCATSRYLNRDDGRPLQSTTIDHVDITVLAPAPAWAGPASDVACPTGMSVPRRTPDGTHR